MIPKKVIFHPDATYKPDWRREEIPLTEGCGPPRLDADCDVG